MTKYLAKNKFKGEKVDFGSCFEGAPFRDRKVTTAGAADGVYCHEAGRWISSSAFSLSSPGPQPKAWCHPWGAQKSASSVTPGLLKLTVSISIVTEDGTLRGVSFSRSFLCLHLLSGCHDLLGAGFGTLSQRKPTTVSSNDLRMEPLK